MPDLTVWMSSPYSVNLQQEFAAHQSQKLEEFRAALWNPERTNRVVRMGDPATAIVAYLKEEPADLVMIPTRGEGAFRRLLIGSVTSKLLHDADCPVWTDSHIHSVGFADCREILCGVDLSDEAQDRKLVAWASGYAALWPNARVRLVHAAPGARHSPGLPDEVFTTTLTEMAVEGLAHLQRQMGTAFETVVEPQTAASLFAGLAAGSPEETVVVIGRGRHSGLLGRLGSQAFGIIRSSPCPVISV
jgi:nucleotide-binding universal stress UspA family protein